MLCLSNVLSMHCSNNEGSIFECCAYQISSLWIVLSVKDLSMNYLSVKFCCYQMFCQWIVLSMKDPSMNYLSINCCVYKMSCLWNTCLWNGLSMKWPVYEMSCLWNILSMKFPIHEMSCLWNICLWNVLSIKCPICEMLSIHCYAHNLLFLWVVVSMNCQAK